MPIDRDSFDKGSDETVEKVKKIFLDQPETGFAQEDIEQKTKLDPVDILVVLLDLCDRGFLKSKFIGLKYYFILKK